MTTPARYRTEAGRACIDITVRHSGQLFDGRDPAPFRERDLDEDAVEYLLAARPVADIAAAGPMCRFAALDRRQARGECEQQMVDDAAVLKQQAQDRIAQLEPPCS